MNQDVKELWVTALRSGDYEQGESWLHLGDKFCCLGVLCDLAVQSGLPIAVREHEDGVTSYDMETAGLPFSVIKWAGLEGRDTLVRLPISDNLLAGLNDDGTTFAKIANYIEEEL